MRVQSYEKKTDEQKEQPTFCKQEALFANNLSTRSRYRTSAPHIIFSRRVEKYCLPLRFTTLMV